MRDTDTKVGKSCWHVWRSERSTFETVYGRHVTFAPLLLTSLTSRARTQSYISGCARSREGERIALAVAVRHRVANSALLGEAGWAHVCWERGGGGRTQPEAARRRGGRGNLL